MKKYILLLPVFILSCSTFNIESRITDFSKFPSYGLSSGSSTTIDYVNKDEVLKSIGYPANQSEVIKAVWKYIKSTYRSAPITDGANVRNVNELIRTKTLRHCGEYGVLWLSLLRLYGVPCVLISSLNLAEANSLELTSWSGHKFIEVFINSKYILLDSTRGLFFDEMLTDRIIPIKIESFAPKGFVVMMRCFDPTNVIKSDSDWSTYIKETKEYFIEFGYEPKEYWKGHRIEDLKI